MKTFILILFIFHLCLTPLRAQNTSEETDLRIVLMSDLNESYGSTHYEEYVDTAMAYVDRWQPDVVLFAGDMIAGQSLSLTKAEIREMWSGFEETIGGPMRQMDIPFAFTLGNHDGSKSGRFDHERELAREYWSSRRPNLNYIDSENFPFYYSFKFRDIFVISWDASGHIMSEEEIAWIERQLAQDAAKNASLRIMLGHLPLYAVAEGRNRRGEVLLEADRLLQMMTRHEVDYYFSGHHHAWYPAEKDGLKMIHSGAQGSGSRPLIGSDIPPRRTISLLERKTGSSFFFITTFDMENNMKVVSPDELPVEIRGFNGLIKRYNHPQRDD